MVNDHDQTTHICSHQEQSSIKTNFRRWLKHSLYLKSSRKIFGEVEKKQLTDAVTQAESRHRGEIQIIIEASLPSQIAWWLDTAQRAEQLFAQYKVWDTEANTGILIYLNLCERRVEIVADRAIHQAVHEQYWQELCQKMLPYFMQGQFCVGLCEGIAELGQILVQFHSNNGACTLEINELPNQPRLL